MIKLKDVIHLYIGCQLMYYEKTDAGVLTGVNKIGDTVTLNVHDDGGWVIDDVKPVLRPLSDMNDTECDEVGCDIQDGEYDKGTITSDCIIAGTHHVKSIRGSAEAIMWLLRNHFDIFGLIESGQAIDATKI